MHYHIEILMPPTDDVEGTVKRALSPYMQGEDDGMPVWWDWYKLGGAWTGAKGNARRSEGYAESPPATTLPLSDVAHNRLKCYRFAVVTPYDDEYAPGEIRFVVSSEIWNGSNYEETRWNGTVGQALDDMLASHDRIRFTDETRERFTPQDDWLLVTVDLHN